MDLRGKTILITRAASQSGNLTALLASLGARVLECPAIKIVPVDDWTAVDHAIENFKTYDWLIFTSTNGVDHFMRRVQERGASCTLPIAAVGHVTAKKLTEWGLAASRIPSDFRAEGLLEMFPHDLSGVRILLPRAEKGRELLPDELRRRGAFVDVIPVYRTTRAESSLGGVRELLKERIDAAVFMSPSAIRFFAEELAELDDRTKEAFRSVPIAAIGPIAREAIEAAGLKVAIEPKQATASNLVEAIRHYFSTPEKNV